MAGRKQDVRSHLSTTASTQVPHAGNLLVMRVPPTQRAKIITLGRKIEAIFGLKNIEREKRRTLKSTKYSFEQLSSPKHAPSLKF